MREEVLGRILACSKALWPERACYQEGCVARGWAFRGEEAGWVWLVLGSHGQL